jgi:DNA repair protein RadD
MLTPRDYQSRAIADLWQWFRDRKGDGLIHNPLLEAPTGAGKSLLIAMIIKDMLEKFGGRRVLILTHQKELLSQNFEKLIAIYPESEPGIYSASLGRKQTDNKVLFCGIQSVYNKAHKLGDFSLILIDECHLIPQRGSGMYRQFIADMNKICGKVPVVGLTATPYRLDSGYLHKGKDALFTDIAVSIDINELLDAGYLSRLTTKKVGFVIDTSAVHKRGGEFITEELEAVVDDVTEAALLDALPRIEDRKTGLVFCVTVKHAHHVSDWLNAHGVNCAVISGKTPAKERDALLNQLKHGEIKCLANVNCLTTGVDVPNIDFLIMLRPTASPGLYVQMAGRGLRIAPGKVDCLVMDYAGNINRHGPIDQIQIRDKRESKGEGEAPVKVCPECEAIVYASTRFCECGYEFPPPALKIEHKASSKAILSADYEPEWFEVDKVTYTRHPGKDGKPDTMRVDYFQESGLWPVKVASEFVCVFHPLGWARSKAEQWWDSRCSKYDELYPSLTKPFLFKDTSGDEFLSYSQWLLKPSSILLDTRGKYAKILDYQFEHETVSIRQAV